MNRYFSSREQIEFMIELVKSLNQGDSCSWDDRVYIAKEQLLQLDATVKELRTSEEVTLLK